MKIVEITYRYESADGVPARERPGDAEAAMRRMNDGSQIFATLLATLDGSPGIARREIRVDSRDLGLLSDHAGAPAQRPYAAVLGCSDARVPIELIFNEGANDLFVVRVAGNTLGDDVFGSLSYAVDHLGESLKLVPVLGHSACGAVTAAVDVFLNPSDYFAFASKHAVRGLIERLQIIVHTSAQRMDTLLGPRVKSLPGYRDALIEVAVVANAAVAARTIQWALDGSSGVRAAYGIYVLEDRMVWAPRCGSDEVTGLAYPPRTQEDFLEFGEAVIKSERIAKLLAA